VQRAVLASNNISVTLPGMLAQISDEMLMLSYRDGDLTAFKELYRRHSHGLYQFIAWRSPRREWVDEITQDSWASLHKARSSYQPEAAFRTYLYQIARNRLIDLVRQQQPVLAAELGIADEMDALFEHLTDSAHETASPETILEKKQETASLHAAIRGLPGEQKEALVLQQFNGMTLEEIAQLTAVPVETVKSRLRYAMQKLRSQLQEAKVQGETA
jgi:RNA polymerase sigma factor (sigma-70 family)